ncbi:MAG: acyl-ACP--UDP-N-acetylglucosamine O-acyltransferase [Planctomycetes bacterium]|nr:acyl-ACP--UDP-N-acetylglucosamine O-acyltransferase [Planctomycetota bacterium]
MRIHPTAQIHPKAVIADDVCIGPFCVIGPHVQIGRGNEIANNVTLTGHVKLGEGNRLFPYAVLGTEPQDLRFNGEVTWLEVGDNNLIREFVTMNVGTTKGDGVTRVGNSNMIMAYVHIPHDAVIEDNVILANGVQLGGHTRVERDVTFGGLAAVHHFVTIGQRAFIGGLTRVVHDAPPFMTTEGHPARVKCVNTIGLKRRGFSPDSIEALREAYRLLWRSTMTRATALELLDHREPALEPIRYLVDFLRATERGKQGRARETLRKVHV